MNLQDFLNSKGLENAITLFSTIFGGIGWIVAIIISQKNNVISRRYEKYFSFLKKIDEYYTIVPKNFPNKAMKYLYEHDKIKNNSKKSNEEYLKLVEEEIKYLYNIHNELYNDIKTIKYICSKKTLKLLDEYYKLSIEEIESYERKMKQQSVGSVPCNLLLTKLLGYENSNKKI